MSVRYPTSHVAYNNSNCARVLIWQQLSNIDLSCFTQTCQVSRFFMLSHNLTIKSQNLTIFGKISAKNTSDSKHLCQLYFNVYIKILLACTAEN